MTVKYLYSGVYSDTAMEDGYVRVERAGQRLVMSPRTFHTLHLVEATPDVFPVMRTRPDGTYLIPPALLRKDEAEDVRRGLELVDPEPSQVCLYPPCGLDAVAVRDGFPLCSEHLELLRGWDDLVA